MVNSVFSRSVIHAGIRRKTPHLLDNALNRIVQKYFFKDLGVRESFTRQGLFILPMVRKRFMDEQIPDVLDPEALRVRLYFGPIRVLGLPVAYQSVNIEVREAVLGHYPPQTFIKKEKR